MIPFDAFIKSWFISGLYEHLFKLPLTTTSNCRQWSYILIFTIVYSSYLKYDTEFCYCFM
uniref:Uncharacterized protein n=1 Tax=Arundo donax TaxID=35708 RepID=A0A0A9GD41_ARUDO